jgi:ATP-dependent RNA/DNA helicase IGHMBP2
LRSKLKSSCLKKARDEKNINRKEVQNDLRSARKEVSSREKEVVRRILSHSSVVLCTCVGAGSRLIDNIAFDMVVIDEAAQGLEAACWIPILLGKKVVLAGDHCQLPPTIKSKEAEKGGLNVTLFERIICDKRFSSITTLLNIQYRMNDLISQWASHHMYGDEVVSDHSVAMHTLQDVLPVHDENPPSLKQIDIEDTFPVLLMIDSSGCCMHEDSADSSSSHRNMNEAQIVALHTITLLCAGIKPVDIGIITPYNGQIEVLRDLFARLDILALRAAHPHSVAMQSLASLDGIDIKTIDGFQGGEKECIVISLVRSNERRVVGFLGEPRRINVAVTRAKRHLAVVCDTDTCSNDAFIKTLIDHFEQHGEVIGAEDFLAEHTTSARALPADTAPVRKDVGRLLEQVQSTSQPAKQLENKDSRTSGAKSTTGVVGIGISQKPEKRDTARDEAISAAFETELENILMRLKNNEISSESSLHLTVSNISVYCTYRKVGKKQYGSFIFPTSLTSYQRMVVHALSEKLELEHVSQGEGQKRNIIVSQPNDKEHSPDAEVLSDVLLNDPVASVSLLPIVKESSPSNDGESQLYSDLRDMELCPEMHDGSSAGAVASSVSSKISGKKASGKVKQATKPSPAVKPSAGGSIMQSKLKEIDDEELLMQLAIEENQVSWANVCIGNMP